MAGVERQPETAGMRLQGENVLCRVLLTNYQQHHHRPLYEVLLERAWRQGLAGATVFRGMVGFLLDGPLLFRKPFRPGNEMPMVIEVVECAEAIAAWLTRVRPLLRRSLVTLERACVIYYRKSENPQDMGRRPPKVNGIDKEVPLVMELPEEGTLLRIFVGDCDRDPGNGELLYDRLVRVARERGLAGATVLRGQMGFGRHSVVRAAKMIDTSPNMPVVIEVVDDETRIREYLVAVDPMLTEGLVTLEKVHLYKHPSGGGE